MSEFVDAKVTKRGGNNYEVTHGDDSSLHVEFRLEAEPQPAESEKQGRPIFKDVPYITIMFPGDRTKKVDRPVTDEDKFRFARQWDVFERTGEHGHIGTPIVEWAMITKGQALEFKGMNIHTVEALSAIPDTALTWLGAREDRNRAKVWLENASKGEGIDELVKRNSALEADIACLKEQLNDALKGKKPDTKERTAA